MRTINTLLAILILSSTTIAFAGNGERILKKKLSNFVKYPTLQSDKKVETVVLATVTVNSLGQVIVTAISTENPEVAAQIKKQIEKIDGIPALEVAGTTFTYRFVLQVQ